MGIRNEIYLIYGIELDTKCVSDSYDDLDSKDLFFEWCGKNAKGNFGILYDVMDGNYAVAGYCELVDVEYNTSLFEIPNSNSPDKILKWLEEKDITRFVKKDAICKMYYINHYH